MINRVFELVCDGCGCTEVYRGDTKTGAKRYLRERNYIIIGSRGDDRLFCNEDCLRRFVEKLYEGS